jgi:hypothetical protein
MNAKMITIKEQKHVCEHISTNAQIWEQTQ